MDHVDDEFTEVGVEVAGNGEKEEIVEDNVSGVGSAEADHREGLINDINQLVDGEGLDSVLNQLVDQDGEGGVVRLSRAVGNLRGKKVP